MKAVLEVVSFNLTDVITTSGEGGCANPNLPVGVADGMGEPDGCDTQY